MSLDSYTDYVAYARQHFEEGLIRAGFTETGEGWVGLAGKPGSQTDVQVSLPQRFPFKPPTVRPAAEDAVPWSWHRELDGSLCMVSEDDYEGLWWVEAPAFLEQVSKWLEQAAAGWPNDRPDLDLDRYFDGSDDTRVYLYDELTSAGDSFIRFRQGKNNTMRAGRGIPARKSTRGSKERAGYVADLGDIDVPPRSWADISAKIQSAINLDAKIRRHEISVVLLRYLRGTHVGIIALEVWPTADGIAVRRLTSAANTAAARTARSGVQKTELRNKSVAIIGVGALGSFIADMLARAGVRRLTLLDGDIVLPGNIVRHLVGPESIGLPKVEAVRSYIVARNEHSPDDINVIGNAVTSAETAAHLITSHDLVVNATADFSSTALLHVTAESLGTRILSVALQDDGTAYRVDIFPPVADAPSLPPLPVSPQIDNQLPELFEAGCGSPIAPTPPHAVIEAAAVAVRHSIGLLTEHVLHPAGESRNLTMVPERNHS